MAHLNNGVYEPSKNWAQSGPIMDRMLKNYGLALTPYINHVESKSKAETVNPVTKSFGDNFIEAAMRSYVLIKVGLELDIPESLISAPLKRIKP